MTQPEGDLTAEQAFGEQVRKAREARSWTQEAVRRRLRDIFGVNLSATAFSRLEHGERPIRLNEAVALAELLDLAAQWGGPSHVVGQVDMLSLVLAVDELGDEAREIRTVAERHARQAEQVVQMTEAVRRKSALPRRSRQRAEQEEQPDAEHR